MARSPEETYIQTYKKYLKQKDSSEDLRKPQSVQTVSAKLLKSLPKAQECKICTVLAKPQDLYKVLNEGLYHKYTASQDYFYTRDINSLLSRKRKPFCVRYNDDLIYDECKERLKGCFKKRDALSLMTEIKDFYTKFKNFPRNFHSHFSSIINSNIRKHRRLEYIKVFNNPNFDESRPPGEDGEASDNGQFNFMEMLGNSFLQDNYKDMSGIQVGDLAVSKTYNGESSMREIAANFKALYKIPPNTISDANSEPFSNALYNKNYMLYSRSDSTTAEDILKQIVHEFREGDLSKKPSVTLAEKVLQQTTNFKNPRKQENRYSPTLKQRVGTIETEVSSLFQASKKSLGSSTSNMASSLVQSQKLPNQPLTTSQRGASNPRSNSHAETDSATILGKIGQKLNAKFSIENLNDVVINRNKILSKLYQFRSTRSKSGGLKSVGSTATGSKTPSSIGRRPVGFHFDTQGYDSNDSKQLNTVFYTHEKSHSSSPERRVSKGKADKSTGNIEILTKSKLGADSPYYSAGLTRSTSYGPNGEFRAAGSPVLPYGNRSTHKKSSSAARRSLATPKKQSIGPMIQNYVLNGHNNSGEGSANNLSQNHANLNPTPTPHSHGNHGNPASPVGGKFINLARPTTSNPQMYYFRHQSPMEEKVPQVSGILQKVKSEARIKNLNMRALKNSSPKKMENYRMATMSMSGRHQTLLDLSHGVNSQNSLHMTSGGSHVTKSRNLRKSDANLLGNKVAKRSSMIQSQVANSAEDTEEKRSKRVLELSNGNINTYKDLKLPSKEQTPLNYFPSSATSLQKFRSELKRGTIGSYSLTGNSKDIKFGPKK